MGRLASFLSSSICLLLVVCILAPSLAKLSHALFEHQHSECKNAKTLHVHEAELDCDFQKFKLSPQFYPSFWTAMEKIPVIFPQNNYPPYSFLSKFQKHHFVLRGPPYVA